MEVDSKPQFHLRIGRPPLAPEGDCWFCAYKIVGPLTNQKGRSGGEDAVQALVNALYGAPVDVEISAEDGQGGCLGWATRRILDCPHPPIRSARGGSDPK
ncbi:DUF6968 family protein [Roseococcus pinisoli]|uniref:DUF6968 family protein n=1 Tax=Roseococcus pinisoli TaxID=2835040 RepID=UPI0038CFDAC3